MMERVQKVVLVLLYLGLFVAAVLSLLVSFSSYRSGDMLEAIYHGVYGMGFLILLQTQLRVELVEILRKERE